MEIEGGNEREIRRWDVRRKKLKQENKLCCKIRIMGNECVGK